MDFRGSQLTSVAYQTTWAEISLFGCTTQGGCLSPKVIEGCKNYWLVIWNVLISIPVKSEVIYLLEHLDSDRSKDLSLPEIMNGSEIFLSSQITYFGKLYGKTNVRESVFHINANMVWNSWMFYVYIDLMIHYKVTI